MRHISLIVFILFLSLTLSAEATYAASLFDKINKEKIQESEKLIQEGKDRKATFILEGVFKSDNRDIRQEAAVKLARIYRKEGKLDEALSYLKEFIDISQYEEYPSTEDYPILEAALLYNAKGECLKAIRLFDYMGRNNASGMKTVLAAEGCGDSFFLMKYYDKSVSYYTYGLRRMNTTIMRRYFTETDKVAFGRITKKLKDAQRLYDIEKYGEGFVLYREAEQLRRRNKNYGVAIEKYKEIIKRYPETIYAEASEFYTNLCLMELGKIKDAKKGLIKFYERLPIGLYRGEALKTLGDIELEYKQNCNRAKDWYTKALKWAEDISKTDKELESYEVPGKAKEVTRPPNAIYGYDPFKNLIRIEPKPGHLINRKTIKWYIPELKKQCYLKRGFIYFVEDKFEEAKSEFLNVLDTDAVIRHLQAQDRPNVYRRLIQNCDLKRLEADEKTMKYFSGKNKLLIMLGDFYHICTDWQEAQNIYNKIKSGPKFLSTPARAYLDYAIASCYFHEKKYKNAQSLLKKFLDSEYKRVPCVKKGLQGLVSVSNILNDKESSLKALEYLQKNYRDSDERKKAYIRIAMEKAMNGKNAEEKRAGLSMLKEFKRLWPGSKYCTVTNDFAQKIEQGVLK